MPYLLVFLVFVLYPVGYGLWLARNPAELRQAVRRPDLLPHRDQHGGLPGRGDQREDGDRAVPVGLLPAARAGGSRSLSVLFILPWAVPSIPTILSVRFMLNPEWGVINSTIFRLTGLDGPNWLNDPTLALSFSMLMHIWKSLPFWTLILLAGRLAIPAEQYEAASVDGATQLAEVPLHHLAVDARRCTSRRTLLSMIWTLGDFNSVYLLTGGGPADLTHVLATLGIRYLRLDQVDLAMASIVVGAAAGAAAGLLHDEEAVANEQRPDAEARSPPRPSCCWSASRCCCGR